MSSRISSPNIVDEGIKMTFAYRALWLSDIHLGTGASRAGDLLNFLDEVSADVVYLTGDIIDLEQLQRRPAFPALHRQVIGRFLTMANTGTKVIYIPGNHDHEFRQLAGRDICGIDVELESRHQTATGEHFLIVHGDCLEPRIRRGTKLERVGATAYQWLIEADVKLNRLRSRLGREFSSMSKSVKLRLKSANDYIQRFEEMAARYAVKRGFDGIVCGHIHRPCVRRISGVFYANDGDWVEHRTALAETADGRIQLLRWHADSVIVESVPRQRALAA